jgi:hypothetical protein
LLIISLSSLLRRALLRRTLLVLLWWSLLLLIALSSTSSFTLPSLFFPLSAAGFFQAAQAYLAYHIYKFRLYFTGLATYYFYSLQVIGSLAFAVHSLYFLHTF